MADSNQPLPPFEGPQNSFHPPAPTPGAVNLLSPLQAFHEDLYDVHTINTSEQCISGSEETEVNDETYDPNEEPSPDLAPPLEYYVVPSRANSITVPLIGTEFLSDQEAYNCYLEYGCMSGFSIVRRNRKKSNDGGCKSIMLTCQKGSRRKRSSAHANPLKKRSILDTGCPARVIVNLNRKTGHWIVTTFKEVHNHELFPNHSRFMRSHQQIPIAVQKQLEINDHAGVPIHKSIDAVFAQTGGSENCKFTEGNIRRFIQKLRCIKFGKGDVKALMDYFDNMQQSSPDFFYSCSFDDENRLMNVFWADSQCRVAYKDFGDVVSFDTTYLTNKYEMPFASFIGANNHTQSNLFACVLLADEKIHNYLWAFHKFKVCFGGAPPAIITDQCQAMAKAIEKEFPNTRHQLCLWHIMQKLPSKLGPQAAKNGSLSAIQTVIYDSVEINEFEQNWAEVMRYHNLEDHEWLGDMYTLKTKWIPAYVKGSFWAGMSTTQRSESMNSFFDGYVNSKTPLKLFVTKFEQAMKDKRDKESYEDYFSLAHAPEIVTASPYEIQARSFYTRNVLKEFRLELITLANCSVVSSTDFEGHYTMGVRQMGYHRIYRVNVDVNINEVTCECRFFEFKGILCAHALCGLRQLNILGIPDKYFIPRWRKDCRRSHRYVVVSPAPIYRDSDAYNKVFRDCYGLMLDMVEVGSCNADAANQLVEGMKKLLRDVSGETNSTVQSLASNNASGTNRTNKRGAVNNRSQADTPEFRRFNQSRSLETYARTPLSQGTPRHAAVEIENGVMNSLSNQSVHTEATFVPLNPPCSPRTGRPPTLRKKRQNKLTNGRARVINQLQQNPHMEEFRAWNHGHNQPFDHTDAPQLSSNMDLLRRFDPNAEMQSSGQGSHDPALN